MKTPRKKVIGKPRKKRPSTAINRSLADVLRAAVATGKLPRLLEARASKVLRETMPNRARP